MLEEAAIYLREKGVKHLLIDLPSVDRERDEGIITISQCFLEYGRKNTNECHDYRVYLCAKLQLKTETYLLNLMIAPFENDATPSKPVLYQILK